MIFAISGQKFARLWITCHFWMSGKSHRRVDLSTGTIGGIVRPPPADACPWSCWCGAGARERGSKVYKSLVVSPERASFDAPAVLDGHAKRLCEADAARGLSATASCCAAVGCVLTMLCLSVSNILDSLCLKTPRCCICFFNTPNLGAFNERR